MTIATAPQANLSAPTAGLQKFMPNEQYYSRVSTLLYYLESYVPEVHESILSELSQLKAETDIRYLAL